MDRASRADIDLAGKDAQGHGERPHTRRPSTGTRGYPEREASVTITPSGDDGVAVVVFGSAQGYAGQ